MFVSLIMFCLPLSTAFVVVIFFSEGFYQYYTIIITHNFWNSRKLLVFLLNFIYLFQVVIRTITPTHSHRCRELEYELHNILISERNVRNHSKFSLSFYYLHWSILRNIFYLACVQNNLHIVKFVGDYDYLFFQLPIAFKTKKKEIFFVDLKHSVRRDIDSRLFLMKNLKKKELIIHAFVKFCYFYNYFPSIPF